MINIVKLKRMFATTKDKPSNLPAPDAPIEITVGHGMKIRLNQLDGTWDVLKERSDGTYDVVDHSEIMSMKNRIHDLEEENRLLNFKLEVAIDMLSRVSLDNKLLNAGLSKLQKEQAKKQQTTSIKVDQQQQKSKNQEAGGTTGSRVVNA